MSGQQRVEGSPSLLSAEHFKWAEDKGWEGAQQGQGTASSPQGWWDLCLPPVTLHVTNGTKIPHRGRQTTPMVWTPHTALSPAETGDSVMVFQPS